MKCVASWASAVRRRYFCRKECHVPLLRGDSSTKINTTTDKIIGNDYEEKHSYHFILSNYASSCEGKMSAINVHEFEVASISIALKIFVRANQKD